MILQNYTITDLVQKIASEYKCKPIEGMLSHQLKQFKIDGEKTIIQNPNEAQRKEHEKCEFALHEVYAIDVLISTGEGVGREKDTKVSIFKKTDENYQLKLKASRALITEVGLNVFTCFEEPDFHFRVPSNFQIRNKHGNMPFNLRHFDEETKARMGVVECISHKMIEPFQVLYEKPSKFIIKFFLVQNLKLIWILSNTFFSAEIVAQFKYTVLLMPSGINLVTGLPFEFNQYESEHNILDAELKELVLSEIPNKSAKHKAKKNATNKTTLTATAGNKESTAPAK